MKVRTTEQPDSQAVQALQQLSDQIADACPEMAGEVWYCLIEAMLYLDGPERELRDTLADALRWNDYDLEDFDLEEV